MVGELTSGILARIFELVVNLSSVELYDFLIQNGSKRYAKMSTWCARKPTALKQFELDFWDYPGPRNRYHARTSWLLLKWNDKLCSRMGDIVSKEV